MKFLVWVCLVCLSMIYGCRGSEDNVKKSFDRLGDDVTWFFENE